MRAKFHDQRKGQWLINKIRLTHPDYLEFIKTWDGGDDHSLVERIIWDMENDEFDRLMGDYND